MENETVTFNVVPESVHPVLQQLKDQIADLEAKVAKGLELDSERLQTITRIRNEKWQYEERIKTVLVEAYEDYDKETIKHIASELGIELTVTKQVEVNVTFTVDLEYEIGEEVDPEWDIEFTASGSPVSDYTCDVVWSKDV